MTVYVSGIEVRRVEEKQADYGVFDGVADELIIAQALRILGAKFDRGEHYTSPAMFKQYLSLKCAELECEVFGVLFLDSKHRILNDKVLFRGTIDQSSVPVREVVKEAMQENASALVFYHNHPSGVPTPSRADTALTETLVMALEVLSIKVLDHFVVGGAQCESMAESGVI